MLLKDFLNLFVFTDFIVAVHFFDNEEDCICVNSKLYFLNSIYSNYKVIKILEISFSIDYELIIDLEIEK